jgi:hypothetical protein
MVKGAVRTDSALGALTAAWGSAATVAGIIINEINNRRIKEGCSFVAELITS